MGSGVVTKAEQTSWQNDSMRWNSNAVDTAGIFQFWFLLTHVSFLDGYVTFKVACVIWLTQVPDPHVPYWNAKKVHSAVEDFRFRLQDIVKLLRARFIFSSNHNIQFLVPVSLTKKKYIESYMRHLAHPSTRPTCAILKCKESPQCLFQFDKFSSLRENAWLNRKRKSVWYIQQPTVPLHSDKLRQAKIKFYDET